ncbi:hypothetical protein L2E82_36316 [Cichorium intybus]|uniref:Uncharacterized protein n=1 Tax=Cichorium intybus TaxID=13427 RepID=A0ACB9BRA2_CICIN|nr:hypothetical protein L1887_06311 [Cichorium endivia]KAI3724535.1 hypothetical protein L2E82_36316 [Cichorium intybus]
MDQQKASAKSKNTLLKFLPRATSSVTFQSPPIYSPAKDKRSSEKTHKSNLGIGFSGPMVSMIPADSRRKIKKNSDYTIVYEPTSPRVSCMGQVKCKHQRENLKRHGHGVDGNKSANRVKVKPTDKASRATSFTPARTYNVNDEDDIEDSSKTGSKNKKKLGFKKIFSGITPRGSGRKSDIGDKRSKAPLYIDKAPNLSAMKRFSSGRGKFSNIDWNKEAEAMDSGSRTYYSDEESDDEEIRVPSSAPVVMRNQLGIDDKFIRVAGINLEPRKEINLWKRRTMAQPKPLQLHEI